VKRPADIGEVIRLLDEAYGRPVWQPRLGPVDELIYTVLSQNTADVNTDRTFASLKARFHDWSAVRDARVEDIQASIALGGLSATKAPRIKAILVAISERAEIGRPSGARTSSLPEPDLSVLNTMDSEAATSYLTSLPGVGPKTAACVLMFALGRPVMPVDTHVYRVGRRLGIVPAGVTVEAAHPLLTERAGPENVYALHVNLVRHGRRVCHARRPACAGCPLAGICPSAALA
jgi:endonuclease III